MLFQNLLSNAVKFHGNKPPSVEVAARQDGENWIFSIRDNGVGIEPGVAERIFERFVRSGDAAGTGLGLAICKDVVERHSGRIWVETKPGKGATFYFTLPLLSEGRGDSGNRAIEAGDVHAKPSPRARGETG